MGDASGEEPALPTPPGCSLAPIYGEVELEVDLGGDEGVLPMERVPPPSLGLLVVLEGNSPGVLYGDSSDERDSSPLNRGGLS